MQSNGAEMLRLACCLATEAGIEVCAPVHDALLIEAPAAGIDEAVTVTRKAMADASAAVLDGMRVAADVNVVRYPDRYADPRGAVMWSRVMDLLDISQVGDISQMRDISYISQVRDIEDISQVRDIGQVRDIEDISQMREVGEMQYIQNIYKTMAIRTQTQFIGVVKSSVKQET